MGGRITFASRVTPRASFVYVSSPLAGPLQTLSVYRGNQVKAGDPLFELDRTVEKAALDQAKASLTFSDQDYKRQEELALTPGSSTVRDLQLAHDTRDQDSQRVAQADWNYTQKFQSAPQAGLVFDTLYRQGELGRCGTSGGGCFCLLRISRCAPLFQKGRSA